MKAANVATEAVTDAPKTQTAVEAAANALVVAVADATLEAVTDACGSDADASLEAVSKANRSAADATVVSAVVSVSVVVVSMSVVVISLVVVSVSNKTAVGVSVGHHWGKEKSLLSFCISFSLTSLDGLFVCEDDHGSHQHQQQHEG